MIGWLPLLIAVLASFGAQLLLKLAANNDLINRKIIFLFFSAFSYLVSFVMFYMANRKLPLTVVGPVGTISVTLLVFVAGYMILGEHVNIIQIFGLMIGAIAVLLIVVGAK